MVLHPIVDPDVLQLETGGLPKTQPRFAKKLPDCSIRFQGLAAFLPVTLIVEGDGSKYS